MELTNNKYNIEGVDVLELCKKYNTPLYVYDTAKIKSQYEKLINAFSSNKIKVKYACKALTNLNILKFMKSLGSGLDTVSIYEIQLGLKAGFKPEEILYTPNGVSIEEIKEAVALGVQINIDNTSIMEQFGNEFGNKVPISIRINPHIMAGGHTHISTGHADSKFGISIYQLRHAQRIIELHNLNVIGLHMHTGSDILDSGVFLQGAEILFEEAKKFKNLQFLDFGSGFKVAYKPDDVTTNIEDLGKTLGKRFNEFCTDYGKELEIWFEPGKFLVSEAGHFLVRANVIKQTTATVFVGVDSGQNHLIRPMFYEAYHHIINISNPQGTPRVYTVVGYICETDTFGLDRQINEVREGDILAFKNAGAYAFSMASNYNSRLRPAEVMIHEGKDYLIRKRETFDDLIRNQVEVDF